VLVVTEGRHGLDAPVVRQMQVDRVVAAQPVGGLVAADPELGEVDEDLELVELGGLDADEPAVQGLQVGEQVDPPAEVGGEVEKPTELLVAALDHLPAPSVDGRPQQHVRSFSRLQARLATSRAISSGLRAVEHDDLGVGDEGWACAERLDELGAGAGQGLLGAGEQPCAVLVADHDRADAVELALEQPVRVGRSGRRRACARTAGPGRRSGRQSAWRAWARRIRPPLAQQRALVPA